MSGGGRLQGLGGAGSSGQGAYGVNLNQIMGQTGTPQMTATPQAPPMATAQGMQQGTSSPNQGILSLMQGLGGQGQLPVGGQRPGMGAAPPIQNPPVGGIAGNPGYSQGTQPQLTGGYWNQIAQMLAGPTYQSKMPPLSQSLSGYNPKGTLPAYSLFPTPGANLPLPATTNAPYTASTPWQSTSVPGWYQR